MRTCGTCTLCCKVLEVQSLAKPPGQWCVHVLKGRGCGIHGAHPADCRAFACGWLQTPDLGPEWKPEVCRFVLRNESDQRRLCVDVDPGFPDAWKKPAYYPLIKQWSRAVRDRTGCVLVYIGARTIVVFPEEDIDIGPLESGRELLVGYLKGRGYRRPLVRRMADGVVAAEWLGARIAAPDPGPTGAA